METTPERTEKESAKKVLTLIVAALAFAFQPAGYSASIAFTNAEDFANEAEKRGYDLATLADLA